METEKDVIKETINTEPMLQDPLYITLLSVVVLLVTLLFWWFLSSRRHLRRSVLFTGLSDAGKTSLFVRLAYSEFRQTFTSMKENIEDYDTSNNKTLRIVDLPGQERLRNKFFDQYKHSAKAIVYVVDSVSIQKEIRDVAEYLYTILVDPVIQRNCPPLLILCNKQDLPMAKGGQLIKSLLEKEINLVRVTKSSQLESVDPSQTNNMTYLGKAGKDFEFSHLSCKVDVLESSINMGDQDDDPIEMQGIHDWIAKL
ncbi:signal recognition particle receptor subunit beta [Maniola hyperantus]|uniref:signal recognition particle receptor subunit beta n=1 Tax=Aphantopus hyperantus TaxID=2795564 RepID=UPI00156A600E|nr:signal recognition particle receptor subunit beta [Maniola hyperantus]XP_034831740.1 signal recognition particle receptor subunit beta [Maniola hyperantus]